MKDLIKELLPELRAEENELHLYIKKCEDDRLEIPYHLVQDRFDIGNAIYYLERVYKLLCST